MTVVIPYHRGDLPLLEPCLRSLGHFQAWDGGTHRVVLLSTHAAIPDEDSWVYNMAQSSGVPVAKMAARRFKQSHPGVAAWALLAAQEIVEDSRLPYPFLFCEPDVTFTAADPLGKLEAAFKAGGKRILGALTQTEGVGLYCSGVAVYGRGAVGPGGVLTPEHLTACTSYPFDVALRRFVLPELWITNLIEQVPATRGWDGPVPGKAVLVHGVKDGSLWEKIKGDGKPE